MNISNYFFRNAVKTYSQNLFLKNIIKCNKSTKVEIIERQNVLFNLEKKRQKESVGRIEKIDVQYVGLPEKVDLIMNKNISTPYDCARHISENVMNRSVVALLNGETLWHMHRPLPDSCTLDLLHVMIEQPAEVNKVFWRTCSFLLGATANNAFKDKIDVHLHSFPSPNVRSGSFVYDVEISYDNWIPTQEELRVLSVEMIKIVQKDLPLEYLNINTDLALQMFKDNPYKTAQIPDIAVNNSGSITLFRAGNHIDISKGPLLSTTEQLGRVTVTAVHKIPNTPLYRIQGVALPRELRLNHFAYGLLEERASKLNSARLPMQPLPIQEQENLETARVS